MSQMAISRNYDSQGNYVEQDDGGKAKVVCVDGKRYVVRDAKKSKK